MAEQTEQYADALAAFRRLTALAIEHHTDLDQAARLMSAHAWVGGGAPAFAAALAEHRAALQTALLGALRAVADLVVRQGGPALALPIGTTDVTAMSAAPGRFQGIEPLAMTGLISSLSQAGARLPSAGSGLAAELTTQGLSSGAGATLGQIGEWTATQSRDLRRRLDMIQRAVPGALSAAAAGYGLFATYTSAGSIETLLTRLTERDASVITQLIVLQERGTDPPLAVRINTWWQILSSDLQEHLVTQPGFGLLNGLPATVRDRANRHWLSAEKQRLTTERDSLTHDVVAQPVMIGAWEKISTQLQRIDFIQEQVKPRPGYPPPLLLGFDLTGHGRLIVSWGNPDSADITVTSVSGLTTRLETAPGDLAQARALWQQASKTSGDQTVASITWYGYDAPQLDPTLLNPAKSVAFEGAAAKGGAALAAFQDGLYAAHEPSPTARAVIVGHSYGSLTTGHAAVLRPGRLADDLILVGSPGVGVDHASHLGVAPKHAWVGEAGGDPVAALGRFGADPGHDSFGAQQFPVGRTVWTSAHSSYWDRGSASLKNMGLIITGQTDQLAQPRPMNQSPQLLMPELAPELALQVGRSTP